MNSILRNALAASTMAIATQAAAQVTFYEHPNFQGRSFTTQQSIANLERYGFNNRASSAVVRGETWQVCDGPGFSGQCAVLRRGEYTSLGAMGLNDSVSSVRAANRDARGQDNRYVPYDSRNQLADHRYTPGDYRYAPTPAAAAYPDYRRRGGERLYQANVTSVRAVVGTPEQRCWVEREQISQERRSANVPGAIAGAVIGGIIGHQVGSGRHQDLATVGGAVAGGALGANVGRSGGGQVQDVQRCENVSSQARPDHWDVTYSFRGQEHRIQMTSPPGTTVTVNEQGEPRA
jgi:uncharacterized protein YcfJ